MIMKSMQIIFLSIVVLLSVAIACGAIVQTMKIAVPAIGAEKNSLISEETARAPYFLIFDENGHFIAAIKNLAKDQAGGVSRAVVALLSDNNVTVIIAKSVGAKMEKALSARHIKFISNTGAADATVKAIIPKQ
jgi:predicted Fe-Mo cluster-binding NifX family protein